MTRVKKTSEKYYFGKVKSKKIFADFEGGEVTSDSGLLLVREVDRRLGLCETFANCLVDYRTMHKVEHTVLNMLRARVYGLCAGWEDLNDFSELRNNSAYCSFIGKSEALASPSTLSRFENSQTRETNLALHQVLVEHFISKHKSAPTELILDFDATDNKIHGHQEGRHYHGYYGEYCFLPLYVFCGDELLLAYLRPSNVDGAKHAAAITKLLVERLREAWPSVKIIIRADSGFARPLLLNWCESNQVDYVIGIPRNNVLKKQTVKLEKQVKEDYELNQQKQLEFGEFGYKAATWGRFRRIVSKAEYHKQGANLRMVVTSLKSPPKCLYQDEYCPRGDMENRIKEQMMLFSSRTSATAWNANQFRLLLSAIAYVVMLNLRQLALAGTKMAKAQINSIRLKIIKVGAVIVKKASRIHFHMSSSYPLKEMFNLMYQRLACG